MVKRENRKGDEMKRKILTLPVSAALLSAMTAVTASADVVVLDPFRQGDNTGTLPDWAMPMLAIIGAVCLAAIVTVIIKKFKK